MSRVRGFLYVGSMGKRALAITMLFLFGVASHAHAQSLTTGAIQGVVRDSGTNEPLAGVTVVAISAGSSPQNAITEADGSYKISELLPGTYLITFYYDTFTLEHGGVEVGVDAVTHVHQKMTLGGPNVIHVDGTPPPIRTTSTSHQITMGRKELESLPIQGPTFTSALGSIGGSQNDGVGTAFSGSTSLENRYIVDGIDITGLTYGDVGTPVLNEFIQEMEVVTGGYNAEYGRSTGGIVNIVTRSGTDELRGSIFGTLTPGFLTAATKRTPVNASSIDITANRAYAGDIGFELGGPIIVGKAWFYAGVAPRLSRTDYTRTTKRQTDCRKTLANGELSNCVQANADGAPDIDPKTGFFLTDAIDTDVRSDLSRSYSMLGKVTLAPTARDQAQLSLIAVPSSGESPGLLGLPTSGTRTSGLTTDAAARWTSKLAGGKTELEAVLAWHRSTLETGSLDPTLDSQPLQILTGGNLGTWSALGGESAETARQCMDGGATDPYPNITNCPMSSQSYAVGGPGSIVHDREERRMARVGVIERVRAAGTHEIKAGLDVEADSKDRARLYSGGAFIQNFVDSSVIVNRWVKLAGPGETDPRFDRTCTTPAPGTGVGMSSQMVRCEYIGGTVGAPDTQIGGSTLNWAAYLRDSWQLLSNLTVNAGVRYEEQRLRYADALRNTKDALTGEQFGTNAMTLQGNFAPRFGVIYDPTREGRSKIYAHWGRFYESVPMDINDRSFGGEVSSVQTFAATSCGPTDPKIGGPDGVGCLSKTDPTTERLIGSKGVLVAPGIQAEYMDEIMAGAEVAVTPEVVFGVTFQHRRLGRVIEDISTDGANTYVIANPGEWSQDSERQLAQRVAMTTDKLEHARLQQQLDMFRGIRAFDKPTRDYDALELSVGRKFAKGLYVQASYTYSRAEGNYPGSVSYDNGQLDPNISSQYDLIELLANRQGPLPQDRPHSLKVDAYDSFEVGGGKLTLGGKIRAISGIPENALGAHYLYGASESFLLPRGQLGRTEFEHGIDLHVAYGHRLSHRTAAELYIDVFNIYNRQGTFNVDDTYAPSVRHGGGVNNVNPISGGTYDDLIWAKTIDATGAESAIPTARNPNFHRPTSRYAGASAQVGFRVTF
ncbi:MAG: TonB-dependent receptor plug [Myxococcales bacterium]|nr:TonB-dependent receptor plug [Myxococcales bacterium]